MKFRFFYLLLGLLAFVEGTARAAVADATTIDTARVQVVAEMLSPKPRAVGRPIHERVVWDNLKTQTAYVNLITQAAKYFDEPLQEQPDDLFLEFSRNGNRTRFQTVLKQRRGRLTPLVLAECLENQGRFLPLIEQLIQAVCAERTWVYPAHDRTLQNFNGTIIEIDLAAAALGWNLSVTDYLLGERLSGATRQLLRDNVKRRILEPFRAMYSGKRPPQWWMNTTNNWNAVCLAGVTGAALSQIESREERAEFIVAAEKYSRNFLKGFTTDGYCSEGLGYWNYGFGHYVLLAETIHQATSGKDDLLSLPEARMPATFGARIQIINDVAPAFADCAVFAKPSPPLMHFITHRFGLGLKAYEKLHPQNTFGNLFEAMIYGLPNSASQSAASATVNQTTNRTVPLRDWFDEAGILVSRPLPGSANRMGVAMKGGHNAEHHNHNDLGSYVVVVGARPVLVDPGSETYTARTFSNRRYDSKLLNSFGHPVPVVAKVLQKEGRQSAARVLHTDFTEAADVVQFDLASAYPVPALQKLERTFTYSRGGQGALSVSDHVQYQSPQQFGTALLTLGSWQRQADGSLLITDGDESVRVEVDAGGREWTVDAEEIREDAPVVPTRVGINLNEPVVQATLTLKITPLPAKASSKQN